jgi:hypothetical protein
MKRALLFAAALLAGCNTTSGTESLVDPLIGSYKVEVTGVYQSGSTTVPADVITPCITQYDGGVPPEARGTAACPYAIVGGNTDVALTITALDQKGQPITALNRPVSFRVVPGDLAGGYPQRWAMLQNGVAQAIVPIAHVSGEVRLWAEDDVPELDYADGGIDGDLSQLPVEPTDLTHAAGVTPAIYFEPPTLAKIQVPDNGSNKSDPFVNQFVDIGLTPAGDVVSQSCDPTDPNNGQPMMMVVTGTDSSGFYVQDLTACRQPEIPVKFTVPEPSGFLPGSYGSMYVYNAAFPEGLDVGDLLQSLAGSIEEFTSTTQLNFASWSVREHVRLEPPSEWDKYLKLVPVPPISLRTCGLDKTYFYEDVLCDYSNSNLKMESLEGALVKLDNVKFPDGLENCDYNGDATVPFFCPYRGAWTDCGTPEPTPNGQAEQQCNIDCTIGQGKWDGKLCSELSSYVNYGQFSVEMNGPGPAAAHLDDSLDPAEITGSARMQHVAVSGTQVRNNTSFSPGDEIRVFCDVPTHMKWGTSTVAATTSDPLTDANTLVDHVIAVGEARVSMITDGQTGTCTVALNTHTRILLSVRDALPTLNVNCDVNDADANAAQQCQYLHAARYDIVGHLQQVQPARPRWQVIARSAADVCCRPGPGMQCPDPIQACP